MANLAVRVGGLGISLINGPTLESFTFSSLTENPLNLSSRVTHGGTTGIDWQNFQSISGKGATGTGSQSPPPYADSICTVDPPSGLAAWAPNQELISQIGVQNAGSFGGFHEMEHLLRFTITSHSAAGYEVIYSVGPTNYFEIVLWKGTVNNFQSLIKNDTTAPSVLDSHWVRATIVGTVITAYHKASVGDAWTQVTTYDTVNDVSLYGIRHTAGKVGMGNWDNGAGNFDDYWFKSLDVAA